jgi:Ca-activated chloride channel family protein
MAGEKLKKAQDAAIEALRRLSSKDIFSVIIYDDDVATIVPAQYAQNPEWIEGKIRQIHAGGSTALFGGVSQGAAEIRKNLDKNFVNRIILLSDGIANIGPSSPEDLGRLGTALSKEGISVTTVGVGLDYNEDLMTRLSQNSDGNTYFVESSRDLPKIFAAELSDVLNVVAKNVRLTIECKEGVKPISIIGREGRIRGQEIQLSMNQLYGNQEKYVLIEVELPAGKDGSQMEVASATVSFENPFTQQKEKQSGRAQVRFSKSENEVARSKNPSVVKEYILNLGAIAKDNAISYADKGKKKEAARALRKSIDQLKSYAAEYDDATISQEAHEMEEAAQKIETEGMDKRDRKKLRTDSYKMKTQQKQ